MLNIANPQRVSQLHCLSTTSLSNLSCDSEMREMFKGNDDINSLMRNSRERKNSSGNLERQMHRDVVRKQCGMGSVRGLRCYYLNQSTFVRTRITNNNLFVASGCDMFILQRKRNRSRVQTFTKCAHLHTHTKTQRHPHSHIYIYIYIYSYIYIYIYIYIYAQIFKRP